LASGCNFKENACRAGKGFAVENPAALRKFALQIIKEQDDKQSQKKSRLIAAL
jgi:hypothetical protein